MTWVVGREYDGTLAGREPGLRRDYLAGITGLGSVRVTSDAAQAERFPSRGAAAAAGRQAWPTRVKGVRRVLHRF